MTGSIQTNDTTVIGNWYSIRLLCCVIIPMYIDVIHNTQTMHIQV